MVDPAIFTRTPAASIGAARRNRRDDMHMDVPVEIGDGRQQPGEFIG